MTNRERKDRVLSLLQVLNSDEWEFRITWAIESFTGPPEGGPWILVGWTASDSDLTFLWARRK